MPAFAQLDVKVPHGSIEGKNPDHASLYALQIAVGDESPIESKFVVGPVLSWDLSIARLSISDYQGVMKFVLKKKKKKDSKQVKEIAKKNVRVNYGHAYRPNGCTLNVSLCISHKLSCNLSIMMENFIRLPRYGLDLEELLCNHPKMCVALIQMSSWESELGNLLFDLLAAQSKVEPCALEIISQETQKCNDSALFLRESQGSMSFVRSFLKRSSRAFIESLLKNLQAQVCLGTLSYPENVKLQAETSPRHLTLALENIATTCRFIFQCIENSLSLLTPDLRRFFYHMKNKVAAKWPKNYHVAVSGVFFLRIICPAILSPKTNGFDFDWDQKRKNLFIYVSKVLQQLANNVFYGEKETHMKPLNTFLKEYQSRMRQLSDRISTPSSSRRSTTTFRLVQRKTYDGLFRALQSHHDEIGKTAGLTPKAMTELQAVLDANLEAIWETEKPNYESSPTDSPTKLKPIKQKKKRRSVLSPRHSDDTSRFLKPFKSPTSGGKKHRQRTVTF